MAETGHIKNVEHWQMMVAACTGFGALYNPNNPLIQLGDMQTALNDANSGIDAVTTSLIPWKVKVNIRENEYSGVGKLTTRVASSFASCGATKNAVEDMQGFARKIAGARKKKIVVADPNTPVGDPPSDPAAAEAKHNSVSQRSYTQIAEHLDAMIEMASNEPLYKPNEVDLQVGSLKSKSTACKAANTGVIDAVVPVENGRITRDMALYDPATGICERARLVKLYVKSVFGATSPQYKQISGLQFTKPR